MVDRTPCVAGDITGECVGEVCFRPGCGNHAVEPWLGEQCDPPGDHCSLDCTSNLTCGNGVVDTSVGEQCDDGNLASHDGCDSRCQRETATWRVITVAPPGAFVAGELDAARGRTVAISFDGQTWEWDGATWTFVTATMPSPLAFLIYDPDRQRVTGLDSSGALIYTWDGTAWNLAAKASGATTIVRGVTYDRKQHAIYLFGAQPFYIDPVAATWTPARPAPPGNLASLAFDSTHDGIVALMTSPNATFVWDGQTWNASGPPLPNGLTSARLVDDPSHGGVVAIDGSGAGTNSTAVYGWTGTAWTDTGAKTPLFGSGLAWSDTRDGSLNGIVARSIWKIVGTATSDRSPVLPASAGTLAYDPARDALVLLGSTGAATAWRFDTAWHPIATTASPATPLTSAIYDPGRSAMVYVEPPTGRTWTFDTDWHLESVTAMPNQSIGPLVYDDGARWVAMLGPNGVWSLAAGATKWSPVVLTTQPAEFVSATYDRGAGDIAAINATIGAVEDLVNGAWVGQLSLGTGYQVVADLARDSIVMFPGGYAGGGITNPPAWERRAGVWAPIGTPPLQGNGGFGTTLFVARSYGRLDAEVPVAGNGAVVLVEHQYTSGLADETCVAGEDADGDGLAGCDDPDCWWACHPQCPYRATCP
jgi:cysteine-rich repeat protein